MKEYVTAHGGIYSKECDEAVKKSQIRAEHRWW